MFFDLFLKAGQPQAAAGMNEEDVAFQPFVPPGSFSPLKKSFAVKTGPVKNPSLRAIAAISLNIVALTVFAKRGERSRSRKA